MSEPLPDDLQGLVDGMSEVLDGFFTPDGSPLVVAAVVADGKTYTPIKEDL